jgi:hypothetical protein
VNDHVAVFGTTSGSTVAATKVMILPAGPPMGGSIPPGPHPFGPGPVTGNGSATPAGAGPASSVASA